MAERAFYLTEADRDLLKRVLDREARRMARPHGGPVSELDAQELGQPHTVVAYTPDGGVPGCDTETGRPGVAECSLHYLVDGELVQLPGDREPVYNTSARAAPELVYRPVVQDQSGNWVLTGAEPGTGTGSNQGDSPVLHPPVRVATTANGTLATAFAAGQTVDGVTLATGNRVLLKDQSSALENGIYVVAATGTPSRAADANSGDEFPGSTVTVLAGTANADTIWLCTNDVPPVLGTTSIAWTRTGPGVTGTGTDNYIARWDGADAIQDSSATLDDSGNLSTPGTIKTLIPVGGASVELSAGATSCVSFTNYYSGGTDSASIFFVGGDYAAPGDLHYFGTSVPGALLTNIPGMAAGTFGTFKYDNTLIYWGADGTLADGSIVHGGLVTLIGSGTAGTVTSVSGGTTGLSFTNPTTTPTLTGTLNLANGGTGASLSDPAANKLLAWDDTDNAVGFWALDASLSYSHATHTLAVGTVDGGTW